MVSLQSRSHEYPQEARESKAAGKDGKPLAGAAKASKVRHATGLKAGARRVSLVRGLKQA